MTNCLLCAIIYLDVDLSTLNKGREMEVESIRFEKFTLLIDGIHKCIHKIKFDTAPSLGIKSVHVFWLYKLMQHPEGLTSAELAELSMIDRSLVSREIASLKKGGYVEKKDSEVSKRGYNARLVLTDNGKILASRICDIVKDVQSKVDTGISEEEIQSFYLTLEKLHGNFTKLITDQAK